MANVSPISIAKGQMMTSAHVTSFARADQGYYVLSGCDVNQAGTPRLSVVVDSGYIQAGYGTARKTVTGGTVTISTPDVTYPRIDVIYVDATGALGCYAGTPAAISPSSKTIYKEFSTPCPGATIPSGVVLALVYVDDTLSLNYIVSGTGSYNSTAKWSDNSSTTTPRSFVLSTAGTFSYYVTSVGTTSTGSYLSSNNFNNS
jgi:hypothetical protein